MLSNTSSSPFFFTFRFVFVVLLPIAIAVSEYVPRSLHQVRLIRANAFQVLDCLSRNCTPAAARPRQTVHFVSIRVFYAVILLVPCLVCISYIVKRTQPETSICLFPEASASVCEVSRCSNPAFCTSLARNGHIVRLFKVVRHFFLADVAALVAYRERWGILLDKFSQILTTFYAEL